VYLDGFLRFLGDECVGNNWADFGGHVWGHWFHAKEIRGGQAKPLFAFFILFSLRETHGAA
jgi:hypothetical protein